MRASKRLVMQCRKARQQGGQKRTGQVIEERRRKKEIRCKKTLGKDKRRRRGLETREADEGIGGPCLFGQGCRLAS